MIGTRIYQKTIDDIRFQPPSLVIDKEKTAIQANKIAAVKRVPENRRLGLVIRTSHKITQNWRIVHKS